jgi:hypothetical protein
MTKFQALSWGLDVGEWLNLCFVIGGKPVATAV